LNLSAYSFTTNFFQLTINIVENSLILTRNHRSAELLSRCGSSERILQMPGDDYEAAVAAFIRARGITRCPTACALPTQGTVPPADRAALADYAEARDKRRAARERALWPASAARE
jgi:hypothetical protein